MHKLFIQIIPIALFALLFSCGGNSSEQSFKNSVFDVDSSVPTDFMDFYVKFCQDSTYQMEHIQFPLKGLPAMAVDLTQDSINNFYWQQEDWKVHKPFVGDEQEYLKEFQKISDNLISEYIIERKMGYGMERRFSKLGGTWYLIYYMDMNKINE